MPILILSSVSKTCPALARSGAGPPSPRSSPPSALPTYLTRATRVGHETLALERRYRHHFQRAAVDLMRVCAYVTKFELTTGNVIIRSCRWEDLLRTGSGSVDGASNFIEIARTPTTSLFSQSMRADGRFDTIAWFLFTAAFRSCTSSDVSRTMSSTRGILMR